MAHVQKLAIDKKSTIFVQSSWNLVKMITSWANHFHQVSWGLDKNCRFFTYGQFLIVSGFFLLRLCVFLDQNWRKGEKEEDKSNS